MKLKSILLNFLACMVLSLFIDAILWDNGTNISVFRKFLYLLLSILPGPFLYSALLYAVYWFTVHFLIKKVSNIYTAILILLVISMAYFYIIFRLDWYASRKLYHTIDEYLQEFSHYLVFAIVSMLQINITAIWHRVKSKSRATY